MAAARLFRRCRIRRRSVPGCVRFDDHGGAAKLRSAHRARERQLGPLEEPALEPAEELAPLRSDDEEIEPPVAVEIEPLGGLDGSFARQPAARAHVDEHAVLVVEEPARALARAHEEVGQSVAVVVGPQRERGVRDSGEAEPLGHVLEATRARVGEELESACAAHRGQIETAIAIDVGPGEERGHAVLVRRVGRG